MDFHQRKQVKRFSQADIVPQFLLQQTAYEKDGVGAEALRS